MSMVGGGAWGRSAVAMERPWEEEEFVELSKMQHDGSEQAAIILTHCVSEVLSG
jgi:hypothetical protein